MSDKRKILVVEDNSKLNEINCRALQLEGFETLSAFSIKEARIHLSKSMPDAIVLDIMLPDGSGVDFCKEIRELTSSPILFLTAVKGYEETLAGLAAGGDDYLNKPFDITLLIAKIKSFLRRDEIARREQPKTIKRGAITLDIITTRAYINDEDLLLSPKEFSLLYMLAYNEGTFFPQKELYQAIWKQPMQGDNQAIKSTTSRLRKKLERAGYTIASQRGEGYCFEKIVGGEA